MYVPVCLNYAWLQFSCAGQRTLTGISSLLLPCGPWGLSLSCSQVGHKYLYPPNHLSVPLPLIWGILWKENSSCEPSHQRSQELCQCLSFCTLPTESPEPIAHRGQGTALRCISSLGRHTVCLLDIKRYLVFCLPELPLHLTGNGLSSCFWIQEEDPTLHLPLLSLVWLGYLHSPILLMPSRLAPKQQQQCKTTFGESPSSRKLTFSTFFLCWKIHQRTSQSTILSAVNMLLSREGPGAKPAASQTVVMFYMRFNKDGAAPHESPKHSPCPLCTGNRSLPQAAHVFSGMM